MVLARTIALDRIPMSTPDGAPRMGCASNRTADAGPHGLHPPGARPPPADELTDRRVSCSRAPGGSRPDRIPPRTQIVHSTRPPRPPGPPGPPHWILESTRVSFLSTLHRRSSEFSYIEPGFRISPLSAGNAAGKTARGARRVRAEHLRPPHRRTSSVNEPGSPGTGSPSKLEVKVLHLDLPDGGGSVKRLTSAREQPATSGPTSRFRLRSRHFHCTDRRTTPAGRVPGDRTRRSADAKAVGPAAPCHLSPMCLNEVELDDQFAGRSAGSEPGGGHRRAPAHGAKP